ncbi:MAG: hypothetical protein IJ404_04640 [Clostridia bacterium]|nr:hypothetical protein [Clostridia bacterium]
MTNLKKIVSMVIVASLTLAMIVMTVSAAPAANTKYSVDLSLDKVESDRFAFRALKKSDNSLAELEDTKRKTWSDAYPGFWVKDATGESDYVVAKTERNEDVQKFDLMCGGDYKSVLAFKAPADGYYDVYFKGNKYDPAPTSLIDVTLTRNNFYEVYAYSEGVCGANGGGVVEYDVKGIQLAEGEEIWVVVDLNAENSFAGAYNFAVMAFDVTYVGEEDPGTFVPEEGTTYKFDLAIDKITSGRFYASALKKSDDSVASIEPASRGTWHVDYIGHWVEGATGDADYVLYDTEATGPILDMVCDGDYKSVLAFKAPADGFYDICVDANKYQGTATSIIDVTLMKKGATEALASKTGVCGKDGGGLVQFDVKNVELKKGDEVWLVATTGAENTATGSSNLGIYAFDFTYVGTEAVVEYVPTPGDVYNLDIGLEKPSSQFFYFSALKKSDNSVAELEKKARATWSPDYIGYWVKGATGKEDYVIFASEKASDGYLFDQACAGDYKSVIAFKAPTDGIYNVYFKGNKYQWMAESVIDVSLTKTGSIKPLASKTGVTLTDSKSGAVEFNVKNVWLAEGEEVWLVTTTNEKNTADGCSNFGINNFDVTYVGPGEYEPKEGDVFKYDLALDQKNNGPFSLAGMKSDGTLDTLKDSLGIAWGEWKGWWTSDDTANIFCETQVSNSKLNSDLHGLLGEFAYIDMLPREGVSSVIVFTAPKTGTYKFSALFSKLKMSAYEDDFRVYKVEAVAGGKTLDGYTFAGQTPEAKHEDALLGGYVALNEGETLMFVASHVSGKNADMEVAVRDIQVTLVSYSTTYNPDSSDNAAVAMILLVLASLALIFVVKKRRKNKKIK